MLKQLMNDLKGISKIPNPDLMLDTVRERMYNDDGVNPVRMNLFHMSNINLTNAGYAVAGVFRFGVITPIYVICTDDDYERLSPMSKRFVMLHEEGHIESGHHAIFGIRDIHDEHIADMYAVRRLGSIVAINALNELKSYTGIVGLLELNKRIRMIKRL